MRTVVEFPDNEQVADEAAEWLVRLDADHGPTNEELTDLRDWVARSPLHRKTLARMARLYERMNVLTDLSVPLGTLPEQRGAVGGVTSTSSARFFDNWSTVGLAAAALVASIAVGLLFLPALQKDPLLESNGLYATAVGQQSTTELADGSTVLLNTDSQLRVEYSEHYRDVYLLQGEALFTVARNVEQPFRVYAGDGRVQAVGTAFSVRLSAGSMDVTVTEGKVSLASVVAPHAGVANSVESIGEEFKYATDDDPVGVKSLGFLVAGEVASVKRLAEDENPASIGLDGVRRVAPEDLARRLAWREGMLMFNGEPLEKVIDEVSRYTSVKIEFADPAVRSIPVGGRFPVGETDVMFEILSTNFNIDATRLSHDRVVLSVAIR